jgi:cyanophycinase-like exopeptidase
MKTKRDVPLFIKKLTYLRAKHRNNQEFDKADQIRRKIQRHGYDVIDSTDNTTVVHMSESKKTQEPGLHLAIFGSGESATTGRKVHEELIRHLSPPVSISLLETPAGYEDNPDHWYQKLKEKLIVGLANYHPEITLVQALRSDGPKSTNDAKMSSLLSSTDYIHLGAGSPTYAIKHLKDSLTLAVIKNHIKRGKPFSVASAASVAFGEYALPVYEIYFAGHDPHWETGLNVFAEFGFPITVVPHWNNKEGGSDIDTRFAYMGEKRFALLKKRLPKSAILVGIDEHTALLFHIRRRKCMVYGKGSVTILRDNHEFIYRPNTQIPWQLLTR